MAKNKKGSVDPTSLESLDEDKNVQVIIETPKGSRNKYAWDAEQQVFALKKVLPEGMVFPHDFGFIPSTEGDDGDPIDVLILMDQPAFTGCLVKSRLVGVIEGEQTKKGKKMRNDRLLAVAESSHTHSNVCSIKDLNDDLLREIEKFFVNYLELTGEEYSIIGIRGPAAARRRIKESMREKQHKHH